MKLPAIQLTFIIAFLACLPRAISQEKSWSPDKLPTKRHGHRIHPSESGLLVFGGFNSASRTEDRGMRDTLFWDREASKWTEVGKLAEGKAFFSSVKLNDRIYALGTTIEEFQPATREWQTLVRNDSLKNPHFSAAALGDEIIIIGKKIHAFRPRDKRLREIASWPGKQDSDHFHFTASVGDTLHVIGGLHGENAEPQAEHWSLQDDKWTRLADAPAPLFAKFGCIEVVDDLIYLFTKEAGYSYEPNESKWRARSPLPGFIAMPGSSVLGRKIHVLGGMDVDDRSNIHLIYDAEVDRWETK